MEVAWYVTSQATFKLILKQTVDLIGLRFKASLIFLRALYNSPFDYLFSTADSAHMQHE